MDIKISELPLGNSVNGDDKYPAVQGGSTKKFSPSQMASYILNTFSSLSLGGVARTVKAAIDAIATTVASHTTLLGDSTMGTTATTVTGAIAEHEGDITTLNSNLEITCKRIVLSGSNSYTLTVPNGSRHFVIVSGGYSGAVWIGYLFVASSSPTVVQNTILQGTQMTSVTVGSNAVTFGMSVTTGVQVYDFVLSGNSITA